MERWVQIKETIGQYEVSDMGRVRNVKTNKILTPRPTKTGYLRVHIATENGRKDLYVHRLVADAFCYHLEGYDIVNHIDFDNTNNRAENLEWTTQYNNVIYSMDEGRFPDKQKPIAVIGEKDGKKYLFHSTRDAARAVGCDHKTILRSCKFGNRSKNGFLWKKVG